MDFWRRDRVSATIRATTEGFDARATDGRAITIRVVTDPPLLDDNACGYAHGLAAHGDGDGDGGVVVGRFSRHDAGWVAKYLTQALGGTVLEEERPDRITVKPTSLEPACRARWTCPEHHAGDDDLPCHKDAGHAGDHGCVVPVIEAFLPRHQRSVGCADLLRIQR